MAKKKGKYGSDDKGKGKGKGYAGCEDSRLGVKRPWSVPDGMPEPPGDSEKIPRPD